MSRNSLGLGFALVLAATMAGAAQAEPAGNPLAIRNLPPPGAFEVLNSGPDLRLGAKVRVERLWRGVWTKLVADVKLVAVCGQENPAPCIGLPSGATLRPPPWNGFSCGSQCPASCRANVLAGPGTYRFGVEICGAGEVVFGAPFQKQ